MKLQRLLGIAASCLISCTLFTSCGLSSSYTDEYKQAYIDAATEYINARYPYAEQDLEYSAFSTTSISYNSRIVNVQFRSTKTGEIICVWDAIGTPVDDYQDRYWGDEANVVLEKFASSIYGSAIQVISQDMTHLDTKESPVATNIDEFLAIENSHPFILAISGTPTERDSLLQRFVEELTARGIRQSFLICYYTDYETLKQDLASDKAICGCGDFGNWNVVMDYSDLDNWHDTGTPYRRKAQTSE